MFKLLFRASILLLILSCISTSNSRSVHKRLRDSLGHRNVKKYYLKKASDVYLEELADGLFKKGPFGRRKKHNNLLVNIEIENKKGKSPLKLSNGKSPLQLSKGRNVLRDGNGSQQCGWTLQWQCSNGTNPTPWPWPYYPYYYPYYYNYYYYYPYYWWG